MPAATPSRTTPDIRPTNPHAMADQSAEGLRSNEAWLRIFAEATCEAIAIHRRGRIIDCNEAMEQLVDLDRAAVIGSASLSLVAPESRDVASQHFRDGTETPYEIVLMRPSGERRVVEVRGRHIDVDGQGCLVVGMRDVTDRVGIEKELRLRQNLLDETQTFAHVGSWELDLDTGMMQGTAETRRLFSLDADEPGTQANMIRHIHPDDRGAMVRALEAAVAVGSATVETRIVRHDGSIRWVLTQKEGRRNESGHPTRIVGISQDTTERRLREDAAIESQRRLTGLLDNLSDVFYSLDATTGDMLMVSKASEKMFGLPAKAFYDDRRQWSDLVHPDDAARVAAAGTASMGGTAQDIRYQIRRPDGAIKTVRDRMTPLVGPDGSVLRIEGYVSDVTAETHADAQRAKVHELEAIAAFKTDLLNAASHELNTPLAAMKLQLYLHRIALTGRATPADVKSLDVLDRNATRLATLINETLDVSRVQSKTLRLNKAPMALGETVDEAIEQLQPVATKAGIILESFHEGPVELDADALRLSQVVFNLVGNALKVVPRGGRITAATSIAGPVARCSIEDSGAGLSPDQIARLFHPFMQVHGAKEPRGGTGLGLFISRGIVEGHGGRIWCESPGRGLGSTFHFEIPLRPTAAAQEDLASLRPVGRTAGRVVSTAPAGATVGLHGE